MSNRIIAAPFRLFPLIGFCFVLALASCARAPLRGAENALRPASAPEIRDDLPLDPLVEAVEREIRLLESSPSFARLRFGERVYGKAAYVAGLRRFVELARTSPSRDAFNEAVRDEFDFFEVYGKKEWGEVFITSYYEPVIQGSPRRTASFTQPLYRTPEDLMTLDLSLFDPKYAGERKLRARVSGRTVVPYFSREEIDAKLSLGGRKLEICWVDPLDAFVLHIQGSGIVDLGGGKRIRLRYADKNGHPYEPLGKFFKNVIPPENLNLHTIEAHVRTLPREEMQRYLNKNPSYVFFEPTEESALTYMGLPATAGRTIAVDSRYFPKGALALLAFDKPVFASADALLPDPAKADPVARFVLDQDVGGAINGTDRVDLFWGQGPEAKRYAGVMKNPGRLYYLAPKDGVAPKGAPAAKLP